MVSSDLLFSRPKPCKDVPKLWAVMSCSEFLAGDHQYSLLHHALVKKKSSAITKGRREGKKKQGGRRELSYLGTGRETLTGGCACAFYHLSSLWLRQETEHLCQGKEPGNAPSCTICVPGTSEQSSDLPVLTPVMWIVCLYLWVCSLPLHRYLTGGIHICTSVPLHLPPATVLLW